MTDFGRSTSDRSGWVAYMKRRAGSWITSAEQLAERVGITRECVTNQLITKCHLSSELFTSSAPAGQRATQHGRVDKPTKPQETEKQSQGGSAILTCRPRPGR